MHTKPSYDICPGMHRHIIYYCYFVYHKAARNKLITITEIHQILKPRNLAKLTHKNGDISVLC